MISKYFLDFPITLPLRLLQIHCPDIVDPRMVCITDEILGDINLNQILRASIVTLFLSSTVVGNPDVWVDREGESLEIEKNGGRG